MSILTRYVLRTHLGPFVFALAVLTGLLFVNTVARRFGDLAGKGLEVSVILEVLWLSLPPIIALTLPMAVLVAVLYAFSALSAENEITALKASGTNPLRVLLPLLITGVLLTSVMLWLHDRVLPSTNHALQNLLMDVGRKSPTFQLKEQIINPIRTQDVRAQYYLQSARIDHATSRLRDVVIYDLSMGQKARTVYADSGRMTFNAGHTDLFLTLYDGWVHELEALQSQRFQRVKFNEYLMMIAGVGDEFRREQQDYRGDREMSLGMLKAVADTYRVQLDSVVHQGRAHNQQAVQHALAGEGGRTFDVLTRTAALEMSALNSRAESLQQLINQHSVEFHKKLAMPFACIVFVLLGAPFAVRFPRGGVGMVIGFSALVFAVYNMTLHGGETLGDWGLIAPFWGPWSANIAFLGIALVGLAHMGRETSTVRGGGWDDLWATLRGLVPKRQHGRAEERHHSSPAEES